MATPELMPNLTRFAAEGIRFSHSRSTFPTETRVNQAALVTGCFPNRHGIVGNKFMDPVASPGALFNTGDETQLAAGDRRLGGKLVDVPVLGEILAENGMTLAVVSAGTPGGTRMLHHKAEQMGGLRLALHRPDASVPAQRVEDILERLGPIPPHKIPSNDWISYAVDSYIDYVEPVLAPEVTVLWLCEPDSSYHHKGIGSPENLAAIRHADDEFGRLLSYVSQLGGAREPEIITLSDHGQLTVEGAALDLATRLREAGFTVGDAVDEAAEGDADLALALDSAGGIYVRNGDPEITAAVVDWLRGQPWCGPVFSAAGDGAMPIELLSIEHRRAPQIALALNSTDRSNDHGHVGTTVHDSGYPINGGLHGGLHAHELATWFAVRGGAFGSNKVSAVPAGIVDVLPTVLHLLEIDPPTTMQGRILHEALAADPGADQPLTKQSLYSLPSASGDTMNLSINTVGDTSYLDRAWIDRVSTQDQQ
jgi:arylsulfatase A-like enzyme